MAKNTETEILQQAQAYSRTSDQSLKSIDAHVQTLDSNLAELTDFLKSSQSAVNGGMAPGQSAARRASTDPANKWQVNRDESPFGSDPFSGSRRRSNVRSGRWFDDFTDKVEQEFWRGLGAADISRNIAKSLAQMSQKTGKSLDEMFDTAARDFGRSLADAAKKDPRVKRFSDDLNKVTSSLSKSITDFIEQAGDNIAATGSTGFNMSNFKDFAEGFSTAFKGGDLSWTAVADGIGSMSQATASLGASMGSAVAVAGPYVAAIAGAAIAIDYVTDQFKAIGESLGKFGGAVAAAANKTQGLEKKARELGQIRLEEDLKSVIQAPFEVMKDAANEMMRVWDESLKTITATQGYSKADLQTLIGSYASRLRDEGLASVVSSADITTNLTKVLESGLSGKVAEEFAYLATKLNAAVPTEDFFGYASTYASVAANALAAGASEQQAIEKANAELEQFANNLLYSSRELAGGFSSGLKNASGLFEKATEIANASHGVGDVSEISGVLTSVSAMVGAIAPDLAGGLVDAVVQAATGGNSSAVVALRSMAGTGASNTAFLQALAKNPQQVFSTLFTNLAEMQSMNSDNYMEVADALSTTFGLDRGAFARVDFAMLANNIAQMNTNSGALNQNMQLLSSGQTTATEEQLRIQKINEYMIDEGLAYVLDNEVARSIQEHMWDEQLALEIEKNTYGVELVGTTSELLQTIGHSVENIMNFLNPIAWAKKIFNVIDSANEVKAQTEDIKTLLEANVVGTGNMKALSQLTTRGTKLNLTNSYLEMLNQPSAVASRKIGSTLISTVLDMNLGRAIGAAGSGWLSSFGSSASEANLVTGAIQASMRSSAQASGPSSRYSWANVGKSAFGSIAAKKSSAGNYEALSASQTMAAASKSKLESFFGTMTDYVKKGRSYEEWASQASAYGITNLSAALSDYGLTEADAKNQFQQTEAQQASMYNYTRQQLEDQFWNDAIQYFETTWPTFEETLWEKHIVPFEEKTWPKFTDQLLEFQTQVTTKQDRMYDAWVDYYINHTAYSADTLNAYNVQAIRAAERGETGQAVLALAQALTSNQVNLKDPVVQTNVILSQILIVAEAIMQQVNNTSTISLPTALAGLGLGVTSETGKNIRQ